MTQHGGTRRIRFETEFFRRRRALRKAKTAATLIKARLAAATTAFAEAKPITLGKRSGGEPNGHVGHTVSCTTLWRHGRNTEDRCTGYSSSTGRSAMRQAPRARPQLHISN